MLFEALFLFSVCFELTMNIYIVALGQQCVSEIATLLEKEKHPKMHDGS